MYWCGYELGGCGGKLMDRLYHDRICHFAHVVGMCLMHRQVSQRLVTISPAHSATVVRTDTWSAAS